MFNWKCIVMSVVHLIFVEAFSFGSNVTYPKKSRHVPHWKKTTKSSKLFPRSFLDWLLVTVYLTSLVFCWISTKRDPSQPPSPDIIAQHFFWNPFQLLLTRRGCDQTCGPRPKSESKKKKLKASKARVRIWCGFRIKGSSYMYVY